MSNKNLTYVLVVVGFTFFSSGCGPKAFTKGEYDDPNRVELLDDRYNEADMHAMSEQVVNGMAACSVVKALPKPPLVIVENVENRTEDHIDTKMLTDKVRTALIKSGKFRFVNKEQRDTLEGEYKYSDGAHVSKDTKKKRGKQVGADYIMEGRLSTNVQQVGNDKFVFYKLTMNLTNMDTSVIDCVEEKELRKKFRKKSIGI
jgi:uncharacterized protein (TIGR02722 family)